MYNLTVYIVIINMEGINIVDNAEWLEGFDYSLSSDITFNLYNTLTYDEQIREFWDKCSDFYHISCFPFDWALEQRRDVPEIYKILIKFAHTAEGHPLDVLICKYNDESMQEFQKKVEEFREKYRKTWIKIKNPNPYVYMVWFFWGSAGRTAQYVIRELKDNFPEKFKELKVK